MYTVYCTVYSIQYTTLYNVYCILYIVYWYSDSISTRSPRRNRVRVVDPITTLMSADMIVCTACYTRKLPFNQSRFNISLINPLSGVTGHMTAGY